MEKEEYCVLCFPPPGMSNEEGRKRIKECTHSTPPCPTCAAMKGRMTDVKKLSFTILQAGERFDFDPEIDKSKINQDTWPDYIARAVIAYLEGK